MITVIRYFRLPNYATVQLCWNSYASVQRIEKLESLYSRGFPANTKLLRDFNYVAPIKTRRPLIYKRFSNCETITPLWGAYAFA